MNHLSFPRREDRLCPCTAVLPLRADCFIVYTGHIALRAVPYPVHDFLLLFYLIFFRYASSLFRRLFFLYAK